MYKEFCSSLYDFRNLIYTKYKQEGPKIPRLKLLVVVKIYPGKKQLELFH